MKKLILLALLPCMLQAGSYQVVGEHLLQGLASIRHDDQVISDYDKHKTALQILDNAAEQSEEKPQTVLNETTISDLSLLFYDTSKPDFTILNRIKRTQTTLGTCELAHMLVTPQTDAATLQQRQEIIRTLVNNDVLRTTLRTILSRLAGHEEQLLALWNPEDRLYGKNMQQAFYAGNMQKAIRDKFVLELRSRYEDFIPTVTFLIAFFVFHFNERMSPDPETWWQKNIRPRIKYLPLLGSVISISNYLNNLHNRRSLIRLARQRLSSLVALRATVYHLEQWGRQNVTHTKDIPALKNIAAFNGAQYEDIHAFFTTLDSPSFNVKNKYLSSFVGPVLSAIPTFVDIKDRICPVLRAVARLDAYLSIATLYKEHQATPQVYSFARYAPKNNGPMMSATNFWHPVLPPEKAVPSSLSMGGPARERNVVLTGPNAAGKSTVSKAIMLNAVLAQTLTIAPARSITLTPFHVLNTYLNIVDNIGSGLSQHRAEVRRAISLIESITQLPADQFALTIMDEMFRCTDPATGAAAAFGIGNILGTYKNSLLILATHFAALTKLPEHTPSSYRNYRVSAFKNDDGSFNFPYQLEPGINQKVIALDLLAHEGFDPEILTYAYDHLQELHGLEQQPATQEAKLQSFITSLRERIEHAISK